MTDVKEKIQKFKRTVNAESVIRRIEEGSYSDSDGDLIWVFDGYPTSTIRKRIFEVLVRLFYSCA